MSTPRSYFFCGIGGSGMRPLAAIVKARGARVGGSDRSRDQGRTPETFARLAAQGFALHPQDGSGVVSADQTVVVSAAIEEAVAQLDQAERAEFLDGLGLTDSGLDRVIRAGYGLLGLITYFTVGPKETRAWTITAGTKAPQAAAVIHNDFERGFIACETIGYADYVAGNGEGGAKEAGKMRVEGRDYVVRDGDVLLFRFNV